MQARKAIILPLGVILKKVDTTDFINDMVAQATYENKGFTLTNEIKMKAMTACAQFNMGAFSADDFRIKLCDSLSIKQLEADKFWRMWNDVVNVGQIGEKLELLKSQAQSRACQFYIISDTNSEHIAKIASVCEKEKVAMTTDCNPIKLAEMPVYTSYQQKKSRLTLIQLVVETIKQQQNVKPDEIILLSSDPIVIDDADLRAHATAERKKVFEWCEANQVKVQNYIDDLKSALLELFMQEIVLKQDNMFTHGMTRQGY